MLDEPFRVGILDVTNKCQLNCKHCYLGKNKNVGKDLTLKEWIRVLHILKQNGFISVNIIGGEPFLRKDLYYIVKHARNLGFEISIGTNATLLTDEIVKKFKNVDILLSCDYYSKKHDKFRGFEGLFDKILYFVKNYDNCHIRTTIIDDNINDCKKLIDICDTYGRIWFGVPLKPNGYGKEPSNENLKIIYDYAFRHRMKIGDPPYLVGFSKYFGEGCGPCPYGVGKFHILHNADCSPCQFLDKPLLGNLLKDDFKTIIKNGEQVRMVAEGNRKRDCGKCKMFESCLGGCCISSNCAYLAKD